MLRLEVTATQPVRDSSSFSPHEKERFEEASLRSN